MTTWQVFLQIERRFHNRDLNCQPSSISLRAALHLEAGPIRCVRGLKSSLVIGQKAQIDPNPLHLEAGPIWWYDFFNQKMCVMTRHELVELGAPKMEGQFLA
jgi:hypothetical protein